MRPRTDHLDILYPVSCILYLYPVSYPACIYATHVIYALHVIFFPASHVDVQLGKHITHIAGYDWGLALLSWDIDVLPPCIDQCWPWPQGIDRVLL